jgi:hypothetical protein
MKAYSSSKIAFGLFAVELQRRSDAADLGIRQQPFAPGYHADEPAVGSARDGSAGRHSRGQAHPRPVASRHPRRHSLIGGPHGRLCGDEPDAHGGRLYGPKGFQHLSGLPAEQRLYSRLQDADAARRIWDLSEQMVGVQIAA